MCARLSGHHTINLSVNIRQAMYVLLHIQISYHRKMRLINELTCTSTHPYLPHYKSPTALSHMHHLSCGISSLLHSVNLILFTLLLAHLILRSAHITSSPFSLPRPFTHSRLKLISFTNHSHSYSFWTAFTDLELYWTKWGTGICFSFFFFIYFCLATCARLSWSHSTSDSMLNSSIVSYHILLTTQTIDITGWQLWTVQTMSSRWQRCHRHVAVSLLINVTCPVHTDTHN